MVKMTIHPAAEPDPALQYSLLPTVLDQRPGNAALIYKMLIDQWRQRENHEELANQVADWLDIPVDELPTDDVVGVLADYPLKELHRAARREHCDWELPIRTEGIQLMLPSLGTLRAFARGIVLQAKLHVAAGDYDKALYSLQTGFALARHTGTTPTLINALVDIATAHLMLDVVTDWVQKADSPNLYWALASLPRPFADMSRALQWERSMVYIEVPSLREAAKADLTEKQWRQVKGKLQMELSELMELLSGGRGPHGSLLTTAVCLKYYTPAKQYLVRRGYTHEQVEAMDVIRVTALYIAGDFEHWSGELQKWFALPYQFAHPGIKQAEAAFAIGRRTGDVGPLAQVMMPALGKAYFMSVRLDREIAALGCIEAIRMQAAAQDGQWPTSLDATAVPAPANPVTGEPFGFRVDGANAVLSADAIEGMRPKDHTRYEIILAD